MCFEICRGPRASNPNKKHLPKPPCTMGHSGHSLGLWYCGGVGCKTLNPKQYEPRDRPPRIPSSHAVYKLLMRPMGQDRKHNPRQNKQESLYRVWGQNNFSLNLTASCDQPYTLRVRTLRTHTLSLSHTHTLTHTHTHSHTHTGSTSKPFSKSTKSLELRPTVLERKAPEP